jgi:hypothetical protein
VANTGLPGYGIKNGCKKLESFYEGSLLGLM